MSSVNTAIQLITREQAENGAAAEGRHLQPRPGQGPMGLRPRRGARRRSRLRPRCLQRGRGPRRNAAPGATAGGVQAASDAELGERILAAKAVLGDRAVILGHFYQRDEVIQYADFVGDSFQLANAALTRPDAEAIVFCGVHFMAETADILSAPEQAVILPNLAAGCSMADMADADSVAECWEQLEEIFGTEPDAEGRVPVIPVTYMNSSAALKAFCGENGGIVCTSSNAKTVLEWAFERGQRVLFFPDQHLGRNTAKALGVPLEQMPMWNPRKDLGGNDEQALLDSRVILWHGFCSVHKRFNVAQIEKARADFPGVQVIVHPECPMEVVDAADSAGSTDFIKKAIAAATEPTVVRHRHRNQHGEPARCRIPAAHHLLPGPCYLPLLHHVPDPPGLPGLGP
jgi:quinolinate synthase